MNFPKDFDRNILYAAVLLALSLSMVWAFQKNYFSDSDYALLLKGKISIESAEMVGILLAVLLPLGAYAIAAYLLKFDEFYSFVAAILFALCGVNANGLFALSPLLATIFGKSYAIADAMKLIGLVLPLGAVALATYRKEMVPAALAAIGLIILPFAPTLSAFLLAIAGAKGISIIEDENYGGKALVFVVFVFVFQQAYVEDIVAALVTSLFIAAVAYVAISLHNVKREDVYAFAYFLMAFGALSMLFGFNQAEANALWQNEISVFASAKGAGTFGVFDYPHAFQYYSGKETVVLNSSSLLEKNATLPDFVVLSKRALKKVYAERPIFFSYAESIKNSENNEIAVFVNERYMLEMKVRNDELVVDDALLLNLGTREGVLVPFTKIKKLTQSNYKDRETVMVNVQEIEESVLKSILFAPGASLDKNATIVEVR